MKIYALRMMVKLGLIRRLVRGPDLTPSPGYKLSKPDLVASRSTLREPTPPPILAKTKETEQSMLHAKLYFNFLGAICGKQLRDSIV